MQMLVMLTLMGCMCAYAAIDPAGDASDTLVACGTARVTWGDSNDQDCDDAQDNLQKTFIIILAIVVAAIVCCVAALKLGCKCLVACAERALEMALEMVCGIIKLCFECVKESCKGSCKGFKQCLEDLWGCVCKSESEPAHAPPHLSNDDTCQFML